MNDFKLSNEERCQELGCKHYDESGIMPRCMIRKDKTIECPEYSAWHGFRERLLPKKCPYYNRY